MKAIVVLPYTENSRFFNAFKSQKQEAFIGESGVVYYQSEAKIMTYDEAKKISDSHPNTDSFVRTLNN